MAAVVEVVAATTMTFVRPIRVERRAAEVGVVAVEMAAVVVVIHDTKVMYIYYFQ